MSGSEAATADTINFDDVFDRFAPFVWRVARRLGVAPEDVPDVTQEVFLIIHRKLDDFRGASSLKTWVYGICVRVVSSYRRRAHRKREVALPELPELSQGATQDNELDQRRAREHLYATLAQLDEDRRNVLVLYEFEDLSMPQVAEVIGCPLTTAYSRLHAARKIVRAAFHKRSLSERGRA